MFCRLQNYFVEATTSARSFAVGGLVTFEAPKVTKTEHSEIMRTIKNKQ
ncbi:hypothetical protein SAMN05428947_11344 [Mucilaginibacter sp. OK283]|nr:hypothetical protein SAMN05428947_11344 [Mucilaginibacter sp. OK283]